MARHTGRGIAAIEYPTGMNQNGDPSQAWVKLKPDGRVVINPTGNAGLGKAGNGDTLTGIIASFAAQAAAFEIDLFRAVTAAVFIAGAAGDIAAERFGMHVMTASDVRECLADAFKMIGGDGL